MASLARIPFRPSDEQAINTLAGWMFFLAIVHFIGGAFMLTCGCFGAAGGGITLADNPLGGGLMVMQMLLFMVLGVVMTAEGTMLVQARSALVRVVATDDADQQLLSTAFQRLKLFFMLELGWFTINILVAILGLLVGLVAPELTGSGIGDFGGLGGGSGFDPGGSW